MARIIVPLDSGDSREYTYTPPYLEFAGFYKNVPLYRSIIDTIASAVTNSFTLKGDNAEQMKKKLLDVDGLGKQTFKQVVNERWKTSFGCGDAVAEVVFGKNDDFNLVPLPMWDIGFKVEKGEIIEYEQTSEPANTWKPEDVMHLTYGRIGSVPYGTGMTDTLKDLLIMLKQTQDDMYRIYHTYAKPGRLVEYNVDSPTKRATKETTVKQALRTMEADIHVSLDELKITPFGFPQGAALDPRAWHAVIVQHILMSTRVSENVLGIGTQNSEESARMQMAGMIQLVRDNQEDIEDACETQIFKKVYPTSTPTIEFSFAAEPQDERFNRLIQGGSAVMGWPIHESVKSDIIAQIITDLGYAERGEQRGRETNNNRRRGLEEGRS